MLKADLHIHTRYSMDCSTPLEKIIDRCQKLGINCVAIADHGTAEGGLKMQSLAPFRVIVAEEILTPHGEIMGMFLKETIPSGSISVAQAIDAIRAQGGLVCIPHPFDIFRSAALGRMAEEIAAQIDVIEAFNARCPLLISSTKAREFAEKYGIAQGAGSDAHTIEEIGNAYVTMPEFNNRDDFLEALSKGKIMGRRTNPLTHLSSTWAKIKSRYRGHD